MIEINKFVLTDFEWVQYFNLLALKDILVLRNIIREEL
jgi:hypothetical protein